MTRKIAMTTIRTVLTMLNSGFSYSKIRHHTLSVKTLPNR